MHNCRKRHARVLCIRSDRDIASELSKMHAGSSEMVGSASGARSLALKLYCMDPSLADEFRHVFESCGGSAVVGRERGASDEMADVVLIGMRKHFAETVGILESKDPAAREAAREIEAAMAAYESEPAWPDESMGLHPKAQWMFDEMKNRTLVMGILNTTPDSFSDGGRYLDHEAAVRRGVEMAEQGADIIDIGGESTRPGSEPISVEEELSRVVPVIQELLLRTEVPISIDTYHAQTAAAALDAGATIINDISGMAFDPNMRKLAAERRCPVVLMHVKGTPKDMQQNPFYEDLMGEVTDYLKQCIEEAVKAGVDERLVIVDPGIGFGKAVEHNLEILNKLAELKTLGRPILVGTSRKATIGHVLGGLPPEERVEGTAATVAISIANGANVVRVHDVKEMVRVAKMSDAIVRV